VSQRINMLGAVSIALMLVCVQVNVAQTTQPSNTDEAAIRQIVQQLQDGWAAKDGKTFAAPSSPDADYVVVDGARAIGREAIERGHTGIFSTFLKDSTNVATVKSIRFLRPDVAVVHAEWNLEVRTNGKTEKRRAMSTMVMTNDGGKWRIAVFQNTPIQELGR
jgi:uncharacterized protein (TIGR02246 family)